MLFPCAGSVSESWPQVIIDSWKTEFQALDATASANAARAAAAMQGRQNQAFQATLAEAQHNLTYAESDKTGGCHNHLYLIALLEDANEKALSIPILSGTQQGDVLVISWTGSGTLQSARVVFGPWQDVPDAANPMVIVPAAGVQQQYYRLRL